MAGTSENKKQEGMNPLEILQKQDLYQQLVLGRKQASASMPKVKKKGVPFSLPRSFGNQVGIDLGTATTVVYVSGKGGCDA